MASEQRILLLVACGICVFSSFFFWFPSAIYFSGSDKHVHSISGQSPPLFGLMGSLPKDLTLAISGNAPMEYLDDLLQPDLSAPEIDSNVADVENFTCLSSAARTAHFPDSSALKVNFRRRTWIASCSDATSAYVSKFIRKADFVRNQKAKGYTLYFG